MKIYTLHDWLQGRRIIRENRRKENEISRKALIEQRKVKLQEYASELQDELWSNKFTVIKGAYYDNDWTSVRFYAMTPTGILINIVIGPNGGCSMGVVK
jgi:hypothetical protein